MVSNNRAARSKGFTLIEILVAATILAVLAAAGFVSYTNSTRKARDSRRLNDIEQARQALEMYRADYGYYPTSSSDATFIGASLYMPFWPTGPQSDTYVYTATDLSGGRYYGYNLKSYLEVENPTDTCTVSGNCPDVNHVCTYCTKNP